MVKITEEMRQAGWGNCPHAKMRESWEELGGEWQIIDADGRACLAPKNWSDGWSAVHASTVPWRPVQTRTWDYDSMGWGKSMTPIIRDI